MGDYALSGIEAVMEELHTDSIDGGHEASYGLGHVPGRGRTPTSGIPRTHVTAGESRA